MNYIAEVQCDDIQGSFGSDSTGLEESSEVRARERKDSHIFYFNHRYKIMTARGMQESRYYNTYENAFSKNRNYFDESCKVSLKS